MRVRRAGRTLAGRISCTADGWATHIDGRLVIDATDSEPRLSP
ncbi:hypothetical protein [Streptomyces sp. NRRL B-24484]|nr:hypothetical protein [Streptomyces sp. NRRL B-24484]